MKTFIFKLKLKNCDKVFKEGFDPGVLITQEVDFHDNDTLAIALFHYETAFIKNAVEVVIKEVK